MLTRADICRLWQEEQKRAGWRAGGPVEAFVARLLKELDDRPATPSSEGLEAVIEQITIHTVMHQREVGDLHGWCARTRNALLAGLSAKRHV